jgi:hypothetical protein
LTSISYQESFAIKLPELGYKFHRKSLPNPNSIPNHPKVNLNFQQSPKAADKWNKHGGM